METTKEIEVETTVTIHTFNCDKCGAFIGEIEEYEYGDDYYESLGEYETKYFFEKRWWVKKTTFCDNCRNSFIQEFTEMLEKHGYKID